MASLYPSRRAFFKTGITGGISMFASGSLFHANKGLPQTGQTRKITQKLLLPSRYGLDLTPARWIWYPADRTLQNTFILFRKSLQIDRQIVSAKGWILGDSRYLLEVNGKRVQWGPAPSDPRFSEADPIDLTAALQKGDNIIGATVLYYGQGDGTWPVGKPGFIFYLDIVYSSGEKQLIVSDDSWYCLLARSWRPGQYKRWYLRALQEEFDARSYPYGWSQATYNQDSNWISAHQLTGKANQPALATSSNDYLYNSSISETVQTELRKRAIPLILEKEITNPRLEESLYVEWIRPVHEFFEMGTYNAVKFANEFNPELGKNQELILNHPGRNIGTVLTFSFSEQIVGWPGFEVFAPEGITIELMVQEGHRLVRNGGPVIMNNHFHSWTRFTCTSGKNRFQTFDYESVKWLQLHIHGQPGEVIIRKVWMLRRLYNWPNQPKVNSSDATMQKLLNACINTVLNNALDTIMDGVGRERQQYSGDIGHELHALYRVWGETRLPARYLNTFSQGLTKDGFFLDTWPAYDRLNRLAQRQLDLTPWGPLLDHGIAFNFDCYYHYLYTGSLIDLEEVIPRLFTFFHYLKSLVNETDLLPVEDLGIPTVWMDTDAYDKQHHKQCAFNLYAVAMLNTAFIPLAKVFKNQSLASEAEELANRLHKGVVKSFWDTTSELFIVNLPWIQEEKPRLCDRSLSTAILFDLCPKPGDTACISALTNLPQNLGRSYPANSNWHLWALGKAGKIEQIFQDLNHRWIQMGSVHQNNTMQESWQAQPDSNAQWSHAAIAPLLIPYMILAGITPLQPGYELYQIFPQPGPISSLHLVNHTVNGPIELKLEGHKGNRSLSLKLPPNKEGLLILSSMENLELPQVNFPTNPGYLAYGLKGKESFYCVLKHT